MAKNRFEKVQWWDGAKDQNQLSSAKIGFIQVLNQTRYEKFLIVDSNINFQVTIIIVLPRGLMVKTSASQDGITTRIPLWEHRPNRPSSYAKDVNKQ